MIIGIGSDLVDVRRIERVIGRHGERFLARIYTTAERAKAERRANRIETYAKRFAAKEAFVKALGTGIHAPANWHGVWVKNLPSGQPVLQFSRELEDLLKQKQILQAHVSLSDEGGVAFATVILECEE